MALGSGMRLNGVLSILLVMLLVFGGLASMSSLEMEDSSGADANEKKDNDNKNLKSMSDSDLLEKCQKNDDYRENPRYIKDMEWNLNDKELLRDSSKVEKDNLDTLSRQISDRDYDENQISGREESNSSEIDWHLPEHITVQITDYGYLITIENRNGTVVTENLTEEHFARFLESHGWDSDDRNIDENRGNDYREGLRERISQLRLACADGDDDSCQELRGMMARLSNQRDNREHHDDRERGESGINIEYIDDGTVLVSRDNNHYEIINFDNNGEVTIVEIGPKGTKVIHPPSEKMERQKNAALDYSFEDLKLMCKDIAYEEIDGINTDNIRDIERFTPSRDVQRR